MILVNGEADACVSALDRGLAYGDGVFETIAVRDGEPEYWALHMQRLEASCRRLGFASPGAERLQQDAQRLLQEDSSAGVVKIIVSRGAGGRGYKPPEAVSPTWISSSSPSPAYPDRNHQEGVALHVCDTRLACNPALAGLKHLNRLEQVLARQEWTDPEIAEGLMCNLEGEVVEGVMSNLFWIRDGRVYTPDLSRCGVAGIMRGRILELLAGQGRKAEIKVLDMAELLAADEVFICNSLIGIWPVTSLATRNWVKSPLTRGLQQILEKDRACSKGYC